MARKATYKKLEQRVEELEKSFGEFIQLIAYISELNDPFSAGHQAKTTQLAFAIAKEMDLSEKQLKGIYIASRIQNVGKVKLPAEILIKPDRLTEAELNIVQTHPKAGYELLKPIEFPWPIAWIVLQHHERLNGSGYPNGLLDEEILLEAKIIGVADVVEAMCSSRSYRPALNQEKAVKEISQNKGTLYDAQVVEACLKVLTEKRVNL